MNPAAIAVRSRPWRTAPADVGDTARSLPSTRGILVRARRKMVSAGMRRLLLRGGGRVVADDQWLEQVLVRPVRGHGVDVARQPLLAIGLPHHLGGDVLDGPAVSFVSVEGHGRPGPAGPAGAVD